MKFDRKTFFDAYRKLFGSLSQEQVSGLEFLLGKFESDSTWNSIPQISYALATIDHESAHTFQPITEIRERANSPRRANQDRYWMTGYQGRGYVQITWKANYEKFGIASDPEKALEPETAFRILSRGMQQGLFRKGHKLSTYINAQKEDFVNARNIINGDVKKNGALIAGRAQKFMSALMLASDVPVKDDVKTEPPKVEPDKPAEPEKKDQVTTVDSTPPVINVPTPKGSITSKIAAAGAAVGPILGATGLKLGGVEFSAAAIIAVCCLIGVGIVTGAILWDRDRERQLKRQLASVNNLATKDRVNVVAGDVMV